MTEKAGDSFVQKSVIEVVVRDKNGNVKLRSVQKNLRVNGGADFWSEQLFSLSPGNVGANQIALSTNGNFPTVGDATLAGSVSGSGLDPAVASISRNPGDVLTTLSYTWTYRGSAPITILRIGLFSGATLVLESLLSSSATISASGDTLTVNWQISF